MSGSPRALIKSAEKYVVSDLCVFTIRPSINAVNSVKKILSSAAKTAYITFVRSAKHYTLVMPQDYYNTVVNALSSHIENYRCNLLAVVFNFTKEAYTTKGVLSTLLKFFSKKKINIFEAFTSYRDVTLIIDKLDEQSLKKIIS